MPYTLVTGASKGIGQALATECAKHKQPLLLVALPNDGLPTIACELKQEYSVDVIYYQLNMESPHSIAEFASWLQKSDIEVNTLINNAGLGMQGHFTELSLEENLKMMNVNMQGVVTLTYHLIPELKRHPHSYIMNVGSLASFLKFPYKAVYSGSKNFILAFSGALKYELKHTSISVSCLCPGPTITNELVAARTAEQGAKAKAFTLPASSVARIGIRNMLRGKHIIVPGGFNRALIFFIKHLPSWLSTQMAERMFANSQHK